MRDRDVRAALYAELQREHSTDLANTLILDELGLCGQVRVDVAVVNGTLSGFELKSEKDSLKRLPTQVEVYSRVLDFATLVTATKHSDKAMPYLPRWWGIVEAKVDPDGAVTLHPLRRAKPNPAIDATSLAQLLWKSEALGELESRGLDRGVRSRPRVEIWERLAERIPLDELRELVRATLRARPGWRSAQPSR